MITYIQLIHSILKSNQDKFDKILDFTMPLIFEGLTIGIIITCIIFAQIIHCMPNTSLTSYILTTFSIFISEITLEFYADVQLQIVPKPTIQHT